MAHFIILGIEICRHWVTFSQASSRNRSTGLSLSSVLKLRKSTASAMVRTQPHLMFASYCVINISAGKSGTCDSKVCILHCFVVKVLMHNWLELSHQCSPWISLYLRELSTQMRRAKDSMNINVLAVILSSGRALLPGQLPGVIIFIWRYFRRKV